MSFDGASYTICTFDMRRDDLRLYWRGPDGKPFANFSALAQAEKAKGRTLRFAMNAGMFEEDLSPVGLFIEDSKRVQRANTSDGASNFHLKPNGVFYGTGDRWAIRSAEDFKANVSERPQFGTQSGPMLVIDGRIHPKILPTGVSEKIRNGVCVRDGTNVIFAISDGEVTFHAFARLFKDGLNCANALFLDGSLSSLYAPEIKRDDELAPLGPMVGVTTAAP